jgi:phosphomannomutase
VIDRYGRGAISYADFAHLGPVVDLPGAVAAHVDAILRLPFLDLAAIRRRRFTVVTDTCHGAGGPIFGMLLRALGCRVVQLHPEPTGAFSRPIEPLARNLAELQRAVIRHHADVGFATDADVDRLSIVSERGRALGEEYSLALAADFMLSRRRGSAVTNLSTSRMIDEVAARRGGTVVRTPVGEANVVAGMKEHRAVIGGEGNGGIIIPALNHARDATAGIALILQSLAVDGRTISAIAADLPVYQMIKETIAVERPARLLAAVRRAFPGAVIDRRDGVKAELPGGWVHVRASGTEPIVRVIAEAATAAGARKLVNAVKGLR